mgnify:FL=1
MGSNAVKTENKDLGTTVMPSEEGVQKTLGEPGIYVPENPQEMNVFKEIRNVDAKELNAQIKKEEEEKEKEVEKSAATETTASEAEKPKYVKKVKKLVPKENQGVDENKAENSTQTPVSTPSKTTSKTQAAPASASSSKKEKEKKGFFSRVKKALS